jgi:hypothetical protein
VNKRVNREINSECCVVAMAISLLIAGFIILGFADSVKRSVSDLQIAFFIGGFVRSPSDANFTGTSLWSSQQD